MNKEKLDTVWIPARDEAVRDVMVVLHGLGDSPEGYRWLPEAMQLPWMNYLLAQAPDAYYGGFSWYDIYGDARPGVTRSRRLLFELLESLPEKGFVSERTTLLGFSQGCLLCLEAAARFPRRLAGIVGISGYAHEPEKLAQELSAVAREQRLLVTHGTEDSLIPIAQVRPQIELLRKAGLRIDWREFRKAHTIAGYEEMEVIREFVQAGRGASTP